ncbi:MAG: NUDIX domain-containing protein [Candidatus Doudnabacteria bacterium]|nr:NUDIX domain-containing protein [Candidatus Doudnabacteria bacterium]
MQAGKPNVRVGVGVFVFKDGKFLMGQRKNSHGDGSWSVPGGHLEFGESFDEAAIREVMEETNLNIRNLRFGAVTNDFFQQDGKHYVTVWMLSDYDSGKVELKEPERFVKLEWRGFDDLPAPLFLPWQQLLSSQFVEQIKKNLKTA